VIAFARIFLGSPWMMIAAAIVAAGTFGFYKGWSIEHDAKVAAIATQDAAWRRVIDQANQDAENETNARVQAALEASAAVVPAPVDRDGLVRLCNADSACRDKHQQGEQPRGLPRAQAGIVVNR
jgi:hypothetical protein